ncbi:MAG TPA: hypothetical protein P5071_04275, partial [Paludibacteraceae bacterium]|nr:hypothetical protein [Paludibacteraceae bacterium]
ESHDYLANWVKKGGIIVYSGRDNDPYQTVQEWWNTNNNHYAAPSDHLFEKMGIESSPKEGGYAYGKGFVYILRHDPKEYVLSNQGDKEFVEIVKKMYEEKAKGGKMIFKNNFFLQRENYDLISVLDESVSSEPFIVKGLYVDLFDPKLPIVSEKVVQPGSQAFLYNLKKIKSSKRPCVIATAARIYNEEIKSGNYSFIAKSPINTVNSMRIFLPSKPTSCSIKDNNGKIAENTFYEWDALSKTCHLEFDNNPEGITVTIQF